MRDHPIIRAILTGRFSLLLGSLACNFFVLPLIPGKEAVMDQVIRLFGLVVLVSCLRAVVVSRRYFLFLLGFSLLNVAMGSLEALNPHDSPRLILIVLFIRLIYYVLIFASITRFVVRCKTVTADTICGGISAYALLGILWAMIYSIFYVHNPASFTLPVEWTQEVSATSQAPQLWSFYYSFVTLTTLGFGDLTPSTLLAQTYSWLEAACGQLFLAVLVARLVALQIMHSHGHAEQSTDGSLCTREKGVDP